MDNQVNCRFKIGLKGVHWRSLPVYTVSIDSQVKIIGEFDLPSESVELVEFDAMLDSNEQHELEIRLEHKYHHDTVLDTDGNIVRDMSLEIESIELDHSELGEYKLTGTFIPDDRSLPVEKGQLVLQRPGSYRIEFAVIGDTI